MIEFRNVCFSYGDKQILKDFNLKIEDGERVCLFGKSGIGKTTVLRLIMGLEKPQSGEITVSGSVSAVFQEDRLLPFRTVGENISFVSGNTDFQPFLEKLNISDVKDEYPSALSGGMARRTAIVRALAGKRDIFIFDEPFTGLDRSNIQSACELINEITQGKTVVCVLHEKDYAADLNCKTIEL